jgi:hypothetical protein
MCNANRTRRRRSDALKKRRNHSRKLGEPLVDRSDFVEEGGRIWTMRVRSKPDDYQILLAKESVRIVERLDVRVRLRQLAIRVDLDMDIQCTESENRRDEEDSGQYARSVSNDKF